MKCILVDDEPLAVEILESLCQKTPQLELKGAFTNPLEAHYFLVENTVDLIFIDINMPDLSGIQLVNALETKPLIIFTTAYPQHAVTGFELDAVDYLLKPIAFDRFLKAVQRAKKRFDQQHAVPAKAGTVQEAPVPEPQEPGFIFVKSGYRHLKLETKGIRYIQSEKNYLVLVTEEKRVMTLLNMEQALDLLPTGQFLRIHKSYIVALQHITELDKHSVTLGEITLPIGDAYRQAFFKAIEKRALKP